MVYIEHDFSDFLLNKIIYFLNGIISFINFIKLRMTKLFFN